MNYQIGDEVEVVEQRISDDPPRGARARVIDITHDDTPFVRLDWGGGWWVEPGQVRPACAARLETAEAGRAIGSALADRNTWRHVVNRVRSLLDLPALDTEGCCAEEGEATVEHVRMVVRDAARLPDVVERAKWLECQRDRDRDRMRDDNITIAELRKRINELEAKTIALGGEP